MRRIIQRSGQQYLLHLLYTSQQSMPMPSTCAIALLKGRWSIDCTCGTTMLWSARASHTSACNSRCKARTPVRLSVASLSLLTTFKAYSLGADVDVCYASALKTLWEERQPLLPNRYCIRKNWTVVWPAKSVSRDDDITFNCVWRRCSPITRHSRLDIFELKLQVLHLCVDWRFLNYFILNSIIIYSFNNTFWGKRNICYMC